jgi:hypothetical protein
MKQSRLFSYLFCLLALSFVNSLAAQKAISVESFSEIVLTGRLNVELKIADKEEVIIETKGIEVEDIGVNVKGGVLKINALNAFKNKNIEINIIIYHKDLYEISASAGAIVTKEETLNGDKLDLDVSSGAKISIDVNVKSLKAFCSSGANLLLSGKVESGQLTATRLCEFTFRYADAPAVDEAMQIVFESNTYEIEGIQIWGRQETIKAITKLKI